MPAARPKRPFGRVRALVQTFSLAAHGVEVATIPEFGRAAKVSQSARALLSLARSFRPDVLHAPMMSSAVLGFAVSKVVRAPLVTTMHNSFDRHSVVKRLGKVIVAVSEAERRLLLSRGYPPGRVVTVLNGADGSSRQALEADGIGPLARPAWSPSRVCTSARPWVT